MRIASAAVPPALRGCGTLLGSFGLLGYANRLMPLGDDLATVNLVSVLVFLAVSTVWVALPFIRLLRAQSAEMRREAAAELNGACVLAPYLAVLPILLDASTTRLGLVGWVHSPQPDAVTILLSQPGPFLCAGLALLAASLLPGRTHVQAEAA